MISSSHPTYATLNISMTCKRYNVVKESLFSDAIFFGIFSPLFSTCVLALELRGTRKVVTILPGTRLPLIKVFDLVL